MPLGAVGRRGSEMMRAIQTGLPAAGICAVLAASPASSQTLLGSIASVDRQHAVAVQHDYTFLERGADVRRFVQLGLLVRVRGNVHYKLASVSHPYARPAVRTFIERLAAQYHAACGEPLVVTSLTRPEVRQPRNASDLSVHPAGMALDLRYSRNSRCRRWLEKTLLSLEERDVLEADRTRPLSVAPGTIITPQARDTARSLGLRILEEPRR